MTVISNNVNNEEEEVCEEEIEDGLYENDSSCGSEETTEKNKSPLSSSSGFKQFVSSKQPFYKMSLKIGNYSDPRSFLEKLTDVGSYLDIFLKVPKIESEENRFLEILKFYISQWIQKKDAKSPFNPVLGEIFQCKWDHSDDSTTEYFSEQISHHPPISSFCMYNQKNSVVFHSTLSPTSKFWGNSFESSMEGKLVFELPTHDEVYVVDTPKIVAKGIFVGTLTAEATGSTVLKCDKTGYYAEIEFKSKGIFNKQVSLVVKVKHVSSPKKNLYTLEGRFDGTVSITSMKTNKTTSFFDVNSDSLQPIVPSEEHLEDNNSRKVWKHVISNLLESNQDEAQKQKVIVEEHQRALAKQREGKAWVPKHFIKNQDGVTSDDDNNIFYQFLKLNDIKKQFEKE